MPTFILEIVMKEYLPRLSIELTPEQQADLQRLLPWGQKTAFFRPIIEDVIRLLKEHGHKFIGAVSSRQISLEDYMYTRTGDKDETGRPKKELLGNALHGESRDNKSDKS